MSNDEWVVQTIKIVLGMILFVAFSIWGAKVIHLLELIAHNTAI